MGILLARETVEKVSGMRLRGFGRQEVFEPLGMQNSALDRKPGWRISDTVWCYESLGTDPKDIEQFVTNTEH